MPSIKELSLRSWPSGVPTEAQYPLGRVPLAEYLTLRAREHPEKPALIFYGRIVSYRELEESSNRLAGYLLQQGVKKGDRVALFLLNCPQYYIAHYAALKIGAILVPCSPLFKEMELEYQLLDAGVETLLTLDLLFPVAQKVLGKVQLKRLIVTNLNDYLPEEATLPLIEMMQIKKSPIPGTVDFLEALSSGDAAPPEVRVELDDVALLQYTGGTTGLPKGAMLSQFAVLFKSATSWSNARIVNADTVGLAITPVFHIASMLANVDAPILAGSTVVLLANFDPETTLAAIERYRVNTFLATVPLNVRLIEQASAGRHDLSSLRLTLTSSFGIILTEEIARQWAEITGGGILVEAAYGLSETHTFDTFMPRHKIKYGYGSCGIPNAETDIRIFDFDDRTRELPLGKEGEIAVKGPSNFLGYWNRPAETAATLVDGWVFTGDVGRFDEDGYLFFLGRRKEMIKVSGFSVFPEEVELLLGKHPAVANAAVIPKPDERKGEVVKAFIILKPAEKATAEEIQNWARQNMSAYKVPAAIEFVDSLPLSGSGKVLRRLLKP